MANKRRGEVEFKVNKKTYILCMNLGAMAELEDAFDLESIADLPEVFKSGKVRARQIIQLLGALIRGGGSDITDQEIGEFDLDAVEAFGAAMEAINMQGGEREPAKKSMTKKRKKASTGKH